jgi:hypothetical protein
MAKIGELYQTADWKSDFRKTHRWAEGIPTQV